MLSEKNEIIDECVYTMAQLTEDEKIRMQCEARKDNLAIELGIRRRGEREGLAKGLAKGLSKGRTEGLAEGEQQKAREIAKKLLSMLDKPTIAEITGLSLEEVEALEKETV